MFPIVFLATLLLGVVSPLPQPTPTAQHAVCKQVIPVVYAVGQIPFEEIRVREPMMLATGPMYAIFSTDANCIRRQETSMFMTANDVKTYWMLYVQQANLLKPPDASIAAKP